MPRTNPFRLREMPISAGLVAQMRDLARPLVNEADLDPLMLQIGAAHLVLLGEASHGTRVIGQREVGSFVTGTQRERRFISPEHRPDSAAFAAPSQVSSDSSYAGSSNRHPF